jgi:hypothetical protein
VSPHLSGKKLGLMVVHLSSQQQQEAVGLQDCNPGLPGQKVIPYPQNNQSKKGLEIWLKH